ncbi:uncharacterized protein J7T54_001141 [Emericellopsis cladophorae]|uniref:Uncharacterized protein n=1 Tax=Emericellopsis cladophorae TaxID=2686198 RepID=A0A9Q0BCS3_9HYPO|nr:uncharacterized protein J7T54_001141 [Emericellopsis cladophorae]KAI6780637.1 hypothetical protein J7T54_001141 [Emericellopsis cladophorae]
MDAPSPKRRRTSPPNDGNSEATDAPRPSSQQSRTNRPSYASPTKTSMARFNPSILERRISVSPPKSPSPVRRILPIRSPAKPAPRPLPPPADEDEEEFDPFARRGLRRSTDAAAVQPPPEPDLPPSVDDPVTSTPPRGIHSSSSPSRRRTFKSKTKPSSPLKNPPVRPDTDMENAMASPSKRKLFATATQPSRLRQTTVLSDESDNVRNLPTFDENTHKRRELEALRTELATLRNDLQVTGRQNERIRALQKAGRTVSLSEEEDIQRILKRHYAPGGVDSCPTQSHLLAKAALNPMALLPFAKPAVSVLPSNEAEKDKARIKSHRPVPMTAEEELPFLRLFSPFEVLGAMSMAPTAADQPSQQFYTVHLRSRRAPGLFAAKMELTIDVHQLRITSLDVPTLEPSAKSELGAFLKKICTGQCNRSMQRNVGIASWAMGEWVRVAEQRAQFWCQLQAELGSAEAILEMNQKLRTPKPRKRRDGEQDGEEDTKMTPSHVDLLLYMGKQAIDVQIPPPGGSSPSVASVRFQWRIDFEWSGEAHSKVAVLLGAPGKWRQADGKGALGKVPKLFEELVEGGEQPRVAVRKVVSLLVGES